MPRRDGLENRFHFTEVTRANRLSRAHLCLALACWPYGLKQRVRWTMGRRLLPFDPVAAQAPEAAALGKRRSIDVEEGASCKFSLEY